MGNRAISPQREPQSLPPQPLGSRPSPRGGFELVFLLTGIVTTMLGPLLPLLEARWHWTDQEAGRLFLVQFLGSFCSSMVSGKITRTVGRHAVALACVLMGSGTLALAWGYGPAAWIGIFAAGTGLGLSIPLVNLAVAKRHPMRAAAALNLLNFCWGFGAISVPLFVAPFRSQPSLFLVLLGGVLLIASLWLRDIPLGSEPVLQSSVRNTPAGRVWGIRPNIFHGIFFLYSGTEAALAGWSALLAARSSKGTKEPYWLLATSAFWGALLLGRLLAPLVLRRVRERTAIRIGLVLSILGMSLLLIAPNLWSINLSLAVVGFGLSAVFPGFIAAAVRLAPAKSVPESMGRLFACAALGAAVLPWLVGVAATWAGTLARALVVPLCGAIAVLSLEARLRWPAGASPAQHG